MNIKSASGVVIYTSDVAASTAFYEQLGLNFKRKEPSRATGYLNWYWVELVLSDKPNSGNGPTLYFSVENIDETVAGCKSAHLNIESGPQKTDLGNIEIGLRDPDGNSVVLFSRA